MTELENSPDRKAGAIFATLSLVGVTALAACGVSRPCETSEPLDNPSFPTRVELPNEEELLLGMSSFAGEGYVAQVFDQNGLYAGKRLASYELTALTTPGDYRGVIPVSKGYDLVVDVSENNNSINTICIAQAEPRAVSTR